MPEDRRERLLQYGELLSDATERMGIVSRNDLGRVLGKHVRESLENLVDALPEGARVLDVGTGGGLPGIPLAIVRPDLQITLLELRDKKVAFLERARMLLGLRNVEVLGGRLEDISQRAASGWDVAVARAVAWNRDMVRALRACLSPEGVLIRYGPSQGVPAGVRVIPLAGPDARAVQIWPPPTWDHLPEAR